MESSTSSTENINLKLLRVNGQFKVFQFPPSASASIIAKHVFENWPEDWTTEQVKTHTVLRLIYQGRFLHGNATLGALRVPGGKTTVMHLVSRSSLPQPQSQGVEERDKSESSQCCRASCCNIS